MTNLNPDHAKHANWLFAQECIFTYGAKSAAALPEIKFPEVAFLGRSNVGKSSLLNALTSRNRLARVSNRPGSTSQINFFLLATAYMLVDLPGYGYAAKSKVILADLSKLITSYVKTSTTLQRICLLIDARFPLKKIDQEMMKTLDLSGASYQIVMTKIDKIPKMQLNEHLEILQIAQKQHSAMHPDIILTSAKSKLGISDLKLALAKIFTPEIFH
ncbi:MAG: hypothetical protein RIT35_1007 [Pseudomonadota bacterium]|jgi:GTP-binding protein